MKNKNIIKLALLCFFLWLNFNSTVTAQKKTSVINLQGIVTDNFGNPLGGAEIRLKNSEKMAATNINGTFEINVTDPLAVFEISRDGYFSTEVTKGDKLKLEIVLQKDASNRDRKIATRYDKKSVYTLGSPVATITGEELLKTPYINLAAALVGQLPGLLCRETGAEPGNEGFTLNIRGRGTTNGTAALILIDGVPMSNLQGINPRDVASVSVYKDAASTILYGMQAPSGIVSIITKEGDFGKARINVSASYSFQQPTRTPHMLSSGDYATLKNQATANDAITTLPFTTTDIARYYKNYQSGDSAGLYPNNNWYSTFMQPMVQTQRYNLSAVGGIDGLKYYTNIGYSNVGSPYKTANGGTPQSLDRFEFRSNLNVKLNKYVSTYMKIAGRIERDNGSNTDAPTIYSNIFNFAPTMYGPLTPDGKVITNALGTNPTYGLINSGGNLTTTSTNINTIAGLNVDLGFVTNGLSASVTGMFNGSATSNVNGTRGYERWTRNLGRTDSLLFIKQGTQLVTPLTLTKSVTTSYYSYFDGSLKYEKQFGIHSISALVFARYQYTNLANLDINGFLPYIRETSGGQLNYSLSNILFANVAASYEGTEQFAPGSQYGLFPAGSLAWVVSNHDFLKNNKIITFLKLRASYGINGSDQLGGTRLVYLDNMYKGTTTWITNLGNIVSETKKGNQQFTWEKSAKTNLGLDLTLFNQLTLGLDVFNEIRTDVVTSQNSIPAIQGLATANLPLANLGKVQNQGFEIQLGYNKAFNKDFSMSLQTYVDFAKNTILISDELPLGSDYAYQYRQKGYSVGQNFGYIVDKSNGNGYFNSQDEITNSGLTYSGKAPRVGDLIYKDLNGDHIIDQKDLAPMGFSNIPQFSYGANLNFKWKNFDATILVQGVANVSQMNSGLGYYSNVNQGTFFDNHLTAWTADRYANNLPITAPALTINGSSSNVANDYYLSDRSYTRLKNVEIGYMLPGSLARKIMTESVRIYVSGNNLLTFDKMNNKDIDVESSGYTVMPISKTFNIGLNVTF